MSLYYPVQDGTRSPTPELQPVKINYKPEEDLPTYITTSSSSSSCQSPTGAGGIGDREKLKTSPRPPATKDGGRKRRRRKAQDPGAAVLVRSMDPNRPDIAREVAENVLGSEPDDDVPDRDTHLKVQNSDRDTRLKGENEASDYDGIINPRFTQFRDPAHNSLNHAVKDESTSTKTQWSKAAESRPAEGRDPTYYPRQPQTFDLDTAPRSQHPQVFSPNTATRTERRKYGGEEESIAESPALAKYAIPAAKAGRGDTLPAIYMSPPRATVPNSPAGSQNLPSLQTALARLPDFPATEPLYDSPIYSQSAGPTSSLPRSPFALSHPGYLRHPGPSPGGLFQPSPRSTTELTHLSTPGHETHPSPWPYPHKEGSFGTTTTTAAAATLPPSTSYPTPAEDPSPGADVPPPEASKFSSVSASSATPAADGSLNLTSSLFKCREPSCSAEPFQTQYLLNSHANVHSSHRPYYCEVPSCPRSVGGKGFKRKNEMNRHGLVHNSPGYACPFCSDQQHRYPRPDNLQRHVKVHHPDKERNDPLLRAVLEQRSGSAAGAGEGEGQDGTTSTRGRRKRFNS